MPTDHRQRAATDVDVEAGRAGDALETDVVQIAGCATARRGLDARVARRRREQVDRARPTPSARPRSRPIPRAGSRPPARRRRRPRAGRSAKRVDAAGRIGHQLERIRIAHQHDRRVRRRRAETPRRSERLGEADAVADRPLGARWITGPSADGSENGTPSSITSAPRDPARASARP